MQHVMMVSSRNSTSIRVGSLVAARYPDSKDEQHDGDKEHDRDYIDTSNGPEKTELVDKLLSVFISPMGLLNC